MLQVNGCQGRTTACDGLDLMPVKLGLRRVLLVMCSGCRSTPLAGSVIVERRAHVEPVATERRRLPRPRWLGRAKVLDHGTVAAW